LGLLPLTTVITGQKISRQRLVSSAYPQVGLPVTGYEIHQGRSKIQPTANTQPLFDDPTLGIIDTYQAVWGTYLHGIFDNGPWRRTWLNRLRQQRGLKALPTGIPNYREQREALFDSLADEIGEHLNLTPLLS
jgi:adenosylcobyric acid synthase